MRTILPSAAPAICALMLKRYLEIQNTELGHHVREACKM